MITSDRQLKTTNEKIQSLREAIKKLEEEAKPLAKASIIQTKAIIKDLQKEVEEFETLREKGLEAIEINDLAEVMLLPIKYRIAKKMSQDSFAKEVDVPVRMIARYESENYRNITGENLYKILRKLHLKIPGKLKEA